MKEQQKQALEDTFFPDLRMETIWITGLALPLTMILPAIVFQNLIGSPIAGKHILEAIFDGLLFSSLLWFCSGSPLAVSFVIAKKLGPAVTPNLILLFSTITYGIWYIYVLHDVFTSTYKFAVFGLFGIGCFSFPVMFFVWVIVLYLDASLNSEKEPGVNDGSASRETSAEPEA